MTTLLKTITDTLNESEDDLFPGSDSSVFDEHNTLRTKKRSKSEEGDWLDGQIERLEMLKKFHRQAINQTHQKMMQNKIWIQTWNSTASDINYDIFPGLTKFPFTYQLLKDVKYDPTSPAKPDIPMYIIRLERASERLQSVTANLTKVKTKASSIRRSVAEKAARQLKAAAPTTTIPESSIPKTIPVTYFKFNKRDPSDTGWKSENKNNPYWTTMARGSKTFPVSQTYAGHPAHVDWKKREKTQFFLLSKLVKSLGLPELNVLYLKRFDKKGRNLVYYMANADKSFQMFKATFSTTIYTKDIEVDVWDTVIDISSIVDIKNQIAEGTKQANRYGKKP